MVIGNGHWYSFSEMVIGQTVNGLFLIQSNSHNHFITVILQTLNLKEPAKSKLQSFVRTVRENTLGCPTILAAEIEQWCEQRTSVPSDEDEPFVLKYYVNKKSENPDEQCLKVVLSTRRLLLFTSLLSLIQIDATYKLVWQGYPVIIAGTSDKNNVFHPFLLAVTNGESTEDFTFVFEA